LYSEEKAKVAQLKKEAKQRESLQERLIASVLANRHSIYS
jgi:hypothetical protein